MPSSTVSSRLSAALVLVFFATIGTANSPDDFRPTPEERLVEAGVVVSIPSLTTTLQDPSAAPQLRYLSAIALGRAKRIVVLETLHSALTDANDEVRAGAVVGLRYLAAPASTELLREVALKDPPASVRDATVGALGQIGGELAASTLVDMAAASSNSESLRINALFTVGRIARPAQREALKALLKEPNLQVRATVAIALAAAGGREAVPALIDAIQDRSVPEWLREKTVRELEKVTQRDFGYLGRHGKQLPRARRDAAVSGILQWWETNRTRYELQ